MSDDTANCSVFSEWTVLLEPVVSDPRNQIAVSGLTTRLQPGTGDLILKVNRVECVI